MVGVGRWYVLNTVNTNFKLYNIRKYDTFNVI